LIRVISTCMNAGTERSPSPWGRDGPSPGPNTDLPAALTCICGALILYLASLPLEGSYAFEDLAVAHQGFAQARPETTVGALGASQCLLLDARGQQGVGMPVLTGQLIEGGHRVVADRGGVDGLILRGTT
jgi:hypothetical protein